MRRQTQIDLEPCVFCHRPVKTRRHHVVPKCKGGETTVAACETCEDFIHKTWSRNELRDVYNSVESIVADERFQRFLRWLRKQQSSAVFKSHRGNHREKRKYR